jgi:hypothetical protein
MAHPSAAKLDRGPHTLALRRAELKHKHSCIVTMQETQTQLNHPEAGAPKVCPVGHRQAPRLPSSRNPTRCAQVFNFDHSFWSTNEEDPNFADQTQVFTAVGSDVLTNIFDGYNVRLLQEQERGVWA